MSEFKAGDIVRLKSGGPEMTVNNLHVEETGQVRVYCSWFAETKTKSTSKKDNFPDTSLELVNPKPTS